MMKEDMEKYPTQRGR